MAFDINRFLTDPTVMAGLAMSRGGDVNNALVQSAQIQAQQAQTRETERQAQMRVDIDKAIAATQGMDAGQTFDILIQAGVPIEEAAKIMQAKKDRENVDKRTVKQATITDPYTLENRSLLIDDYGNIVNPVGADGAPQGGVPQGGMPQASGMPQMGESPEDTSGVSLYDAAGDATGVKAGLKARVAGAFGFLPFDTPEFAQKTVEARRMIDTETQGLVNSLRVNPRFSEGERADLQKRIGYDVGTFENPDTLRRKMQTDAKVLREKMNAAWEDYNDPRLPKDTRQGQYENAKVISRFLEKLDAPDDRKNPENVEKKPVNPDDVLSMKQQGFSDVEIAQALRNAGHGAEIDKMRKGGDDYNTVVRKFAGEEQGFVNRVKQGMGQSDLALEQASQYLADKLGLGEWATRDIFTGESVSPEELKGAIEENKRRIGDAGLGAEVVIAAANPATWMAGIGGGGAIALGAKSAGAYEMLTPQDVPEGGELNPAKKLKDVATSAAIGAVAVPVLDKAASKVINLASKISPVAVVARSGKKVANKVAAPFTKEATQQRVANRIQELAPDTAKVEAGLNSEMNAIAPDLTPAQMAGDERLLGLQEAVRKQMPEVDAVLAEKAQKATAQLEEAASGIGASVPATKTTEYIGGLIESAELSAANKLAKLEPNIRASQAAVIVRDEIDKAYSAAKVVENAKWEKVPKVGLSTDGIKKAYVDILRSTSKVKREDIPDAARKFLAPGSKTSFKNIEPVQTIQDLRSKLLEESRNARAGDTPNLNKARLAEDMADAIITDLGAQANNAQGKLGKSLREALDTSRKVKETFWQGDVGKIISSQRTGADKIPTELTLESSVGTGKIAGAVAIKSLLKAAPTRENYGAMQAYIMNNFNSSSAVKDGILNRVQAQKWMKSNEDVLDLFPDIKAGINTAIVASEKAKVLGGSVKEYINAPIEREFDRIIKAKNPAETAKAVMNIAKTDPTGEAVLGLKTAAVEQLLGNNKLFADSRTMMAAKEILDPADMKKLEWINKKIESINSKGVGVGGIINDAPNTLIDGFARTVAASTSRKVAKALGHGGTLQAPAFASDAMKRFLGKINADSAEGMLARAVVDKELFATLLKPIKAPEQAAVVEKRLNTWVAKNSTFMTRILAAPVSQNMQDESTVEPTAQPVEPSAPNIAPQSSLQAPDTITQHEGMREMAYMDTTGNKTIGKGFNMDSGIARKVWKQAGIAVPFDAVYKGEQGITTAEADALAGVGYAIAKDDARKFANNYEKLSENRKAALNDMAYQMGYPNLSELSSFQREFNKGDYRKSVQHLIKTEWFKQTPKDRRDWVMRNIIYG